MIAGTTDPAKLYTKMPDGTLVFKCTEDKPVKVRWLSQDALDSFDTHIAPLKDKANIQATLNRYIAKISNKQRMSDEHFRAEDTIAGTNQKFYALKPTPIRAYGWYSKKVPHTFIISHCIPKRRGKLADADTKRVNTNFDEFERRK